jgi:hypothetical protein
MADISTKNLLDALGRAYPGAIVPYGSSMREEHGVAFRIAGMPATFSAITLDGSMPLDTYDVQIESYPPGEYIHTTQVSLTELLALIQRYFEPAETWPV